MARSEECRRFGLVPPSIYGGRHESVLATLWRTIASQLPSLGGGALCCLPLLQLRTSLAPIRRPWRHLWWGLCRRERAQAPTLKEVHKEQVGLATHHDCHTIGDKSNSDSFSSLFFIFSFIFVFCFSLFFSFFPPRPITIFCLCSLISRWLKMKRAWRSEETPRPRQPAVMGKMKQDSSGRRDLAAPFQFF